MLNDFNYIVEALTGIMDSRSREKKDICEKFIKAWYLNLEELTAFVIDNKVIILNDEYIQYLNRRFMD